MPAARGASDNVSITPVAINVPSGSLSLPTASSTLLGTSSSAGPLLSGSHCTPEESRFRDAAIARAWITDHFSLSNQPDAARDSRGEARDLNSYISEASAGEDVVAAVEDPLVEAPDSAPRSDGGAAGGRDGSSSPPHKDAPGSEVLVEDLPDDNEDDDVPFPRAPPAGRPGSRFVFDPELTTPDIIYHGNNPDGSSSAPSGKSYSQAEIREAMRRTKQERSTNIKEDKLARKEDSSELYCLQLNLHHAYNAHDRVFNFTAKKKSAWLCMLQEPLTKKDGSVMSLPDKSRVFAHPGSVTAKTRAVIYTSPGLIVSPVTPFITRDLAVVTVKPNNTRKDEVIFASAYMDINNTDISPELTALVQYCAKHKIPLVCGMDSNAHHAAWGCDISNARGDMIYDSLLGRHGLAVINNGNRSTFHHPNVPDGTIIDITLANQYAQKRLSGWQVLNYDFLSDHGGIEMSYALAPRVLKETRALRKADWGRFGCLVTKYYIEHDHVTRTKWNNEGIESELGFWYDAHRAALDAVAPVTVKRSKIKSPWWNDELAALTDELEELNRRKHKDREYLPRYQRLKTALNRALKKAHKGSWRTHVEDVDSPAEMAKLTKAMNNHPQNKIGSLKKGNSYTNSPNETVKVLLREHFPGSIPLRKADAETLDEFWDASEEVEPLHWVTTELVKKAVDSFAPFKACGRDEIRPIALQNVPEFALEHLRDIITACLRTGYTPVGWRESSAIFIPKPGKTDYSNPRAFRPISLTSFLFKTTERLVYWFLEAEVLPEKPLNRSQHGFRRGCSTETALGGTVTRIEKALGHKKLVLSVFLDIQGAFDNVSLRSAEAGMRAHGFPEFINKWYMRYLRTRICYTEVNGARAACRLTRGTPQGGILSPLMWNLCFDSLLDEYTSADPVTADAYADDLHLMIVGIDLATMVSQMQIAVDKAAAWGARNGLTFSAPKTVAMLFNRNTAATLERNHFIHMDGTRVEYSSQTRYLGVIIDEKLSWTPHVQEKIKIAKRQIHQIRSGIGAIWGPNPKVMLWAYTGMIRPAITYGCMLWAQKIKHNKGLLQGLASVQRSALMMIGHFRRSTPGAGLDVLFNVPPLHRFIRDTAIKSAVRVHKDLTLTWPGEVKGVQVAHVKWARDELAHMKIDIDDVDVIRNQINWEKKFRFEKDSLEDGEPVRKDSVCIFTDGSDTEDGAGGGFVIFPTSVTDQPRIVEKHFSLGKGGDVTVFQAEVTAIARAAAYLSDNLANIPAGPLTFFSDSQAALLALNGASISSKVVNTCINNLNALGQSRTVILRWIKAHVGHEGNEWADLLAKKGASNDEGMEGYTKVRVPVPMASINLKIAKFTVQEWTNEWKNKSDCRQSRRMMTGPDKRRTKVIMRLPRGTISKIVRWATGHTFLRYHENKVDPGKVPSPLCRLCESDDETSFHLMAECPSLRHHRLSIYLQHILSKDDLGKVTDLVKFFDMKIGEYTISDLEDDVEYEPTGYEDRSPPFLTNVSSHIEAAAGAAVIGNSQINLSP